MKVFPSNFLILIAAGVDFINKTNCTGLDDVITFEVNAAGWPRVYAEEDSILDQDIVYSEPEHRQKLCYYAKMVAGLPYIDYGHVPRWQYYEASSYVPEWHYAMSCGTVPTMYVLLHCLQSFLLITFSSGEEYAHLYKIDMEILRARSVSPIPDQRKTNDQHEHDNKNYVNRAAIDVGSVKTVAVPKSPYRRDSEKDTSPMKDFIAESEAFADIQAENRRMVCLQARKSLSIPLHFVHFEVPEPQQYDFEDIAADSRKDVQWAIPCSTLPRLYLRAGNAKNELKPAIVQSSIDFECTIDEVKPTAISRVSKEDEYSAMEFIEHSWTQLSEKDRLDLCTKARRNNVFSHVPFVKDVNVPEARLYSFQYPGETSEKRDVAILCPAIPQLYLRLEDSAETNKIIKMTLAPNLADNYKYSVEILKSFNILTTAEEPEGSKMEEHPLLTLNEEDRFHLCWNAQKYILDDEKDRWNFRFASREPILSKYKLLLIPKYMKPPQVYELRHPNDDKEEDMVIQCSSWPQMYVRLGKSVNEIKIILRSLNYFA